MPHMVPGDVHVNKLLTNVGHRFKNTAYIADQCAPILDVKNETDYYATWYKSIWFRDEAMHRAPGAPAPRIMPNIKTDNTYACEDYALAAGIPGRLKRNTDSQIKLQASVTELLTDKIQLSRERRVATMMTTEGNWTSYTTLTGDDQWDKYDTSSPIGDIDTGCDAVDDNTAAYLDKAIVFGIDAWRKFRRHPEIIRFCYGEGSDRTTIVTPALVARAFEVDKVLIGRAVYTASKEGTAEASVAYTKIWSDYCWIGHVNKAPSITTPSAAYLFRNLYRVRSWFDDDADSDVIEVSEIIDEVVTSADCGYLISDCVA